MLCHVQAFGVVHGDITILRSPADAGQARHSGEYCTQLLRRPDHRVDEVKHMRPKQLQQRIPALAKSSYNTFLLSESLASKCCAILSAAHQ